LVAAKIEVAPPLSAAVREEDVDRSVARVARRERGAEGREGLRLELLDPLAPRPLHADEERERGDRLVLEEAPLVVRGEDEEVLDHLELIGVAAEGDEAEHLSAEHARAELLGVDRSEL